MKRFFATFAAVAGVAAVGLPGVAGASRVGPSEQGGRGTGRPFGLMAVSKAPAAATARAEQADRNGNGFVCRMDIPGWGAGNTGGNADITDDKV
jgi:hypothetical protein